MRTVLEFVVVAAAAALAGEIAGRVWAAAKDTNTVRRVGAALMCLGVWLIWGVVLVVVDP